MLDTADRTSPVTGHWVEVSWRGRTARAWQPDPLGDRRFDFSSNTIRLAEQATAALGQASTAMPANWEPLARLLLRTEGIASSSIEGVAAPVLEVAMAELSSESTSAGWIADNLAAVTDALSESAPLDAATLHRWHRQLMGHSALEEEMVGSWRRAPSWIGGTSPLDAAFVPPPAGAVPELMEELIDYANHDHHDPVTQAALVHAQFETIHPYGDGNGRIGRILVGWLLARRGVVTELPPPISVLIARDPAGYVSGLYLFREGPVDSWVRWFAEVAGSAATQSRAMVEGVTTIVDRWSSQLQDLRSDAAARRLVPLLPQAPVLTATIAAILLNTSDRTARNALDVLAERGVLNKVVRPTAAQTRGRPTDHYAATELLDATAGWAR